MMYDSSGHRSISIRERIEKCIVTLGGGVVGTGGGIPFIRRKKNPVKSPSSKNSASSTKSGYVIRGNIDLKKANNRVTKKVAINTSGIKVNKGAANPGLGKISGKTYKVTQDGLNTVKSHLSQFDDYTPNNQMIQRLENALKNGESITGVDASFYLHELKEAELMIKGLSQQIAHRTSLEFYKVSDYSVYHPEVIQNNPEWFNNNWFEFWRIQK